MNEFDLINHIVNKDDKNVVVWIYNIGIERFWNNEKYTVKDSKEDIVVNHMEEMNLLLTRNQDFLILRNYPNKDYLDEMIKFGCEIPNILCPNIIDESKSISELILQDEALIITLKNIAKTDNTVYLVPYGVSELEESIAVTCGFKLIGASTELVKKIDSKVFSRQFAEELNFPVTEGNICYSLEDVEKNYYILKNNYQKVIIKQPYGSSGKGLYIVDDANKLKTVLLLLNRFLRLGNSKEWIVEGWYEKKADINYQIYVNEVGNVQVLSISEQLVDKTVYMGTVIPPRISHNTISECQKYGEIIGNRLYKCGFTGMLGVDAIITSENVFIPIIEINARFTLSSYISFVKIKYKNKKILSFYKKLAINEATNYRSIMNQLNNEKIWSHNGNGVFCFVSETLNSKTTGSNGRFFGLIIEDDYKSLNTLYVKLVKILDQLYRKE